MNASFLESEFHPTVRLDEGQGVPGLWLNAGVGVPYRRLLAALHAAAMAAELASDPRERWIVGVERASDFRGYVYIETVSGTVNEAKRGAALLRKAMENVFTTGA